MVEKCFSTGARTSTFTGTTFPTYGVRTRYGRYFKAGGRAARVSTINEGLMFHASSKKKLVVSK